MNINKQITDEQLNILEINGVLHEEDKQWERTYRKINTWQFIVFFKHKLNNIQGSGILTKFYPDKPECYFCNRQDILEKHHIIPKSMGGKNDIENILSLCPNCHRILHKSMKLTLVSNNKLVTYDEGKITIKEI